MIAMLLAQTDDPRLVRSILDWFDITEAWQIWLVIFGLLGQVVFFSRWIIQWLVSEARGESHVPELFWWCSVIGALMLFLYFLIDRDPVGMLGQCVGWAVYSRNLYFIHRSRRRRRAGAPPPTTGGDVP
jgi:lipid-A-disaccharide synthase-like uncharacterized protein